MDFGEPFGGLMPGARGAALAVLLRTGAPLTGRRVHALVADRHSLGAVQQALRDLERLGLITTETIGRAGVHRINKGHAAIAPLRVLASPIEMLRRVVEGVVRDVDAVIVFGSVARGDAHAGSDVDLLVIAAAAWDGRAELQQQVQERLGNHCDVLHLTGDDFERAPEDREPVLSEILRDGIALVGAMPRRSRVAS
ncbi:nucleotidyltransferase family protein [Pseudonocardia hispaniensis]|uniref:Nucleotidyltransferase family protein n=1 Tax=Pseudonocardia hispaniensis TaxID=904933 RepID=A0ABW1IZQ3_9PSEU